MPSKPKPPPVPLLTVAALRVEAIVAVRELPRGLVPPGALPAGHPVVELLLEGSSLVARAKLDGERVRKTLQLAARSADIRMIKIEGVLRPPHARGAPLWLDEATLEPLGPTHSAAPAVQGARLETAP